MTLYKSTLFMQNKPNFRKSQMNVNPYNTTDYNNETTFRWGKTNPIQTQFAGCPNERKFNINKGL